MDYIDELAEDSVKEAIECLVADGQRCHSGSVPIEAVRILMKHGRGRVPETLAWAKIDDAIHRLRERKELKAPLERQYTWVLVDQPRKAAELK